MSLGFGALSDVSLSEVFWVVICVFVFGWLFLGLLSGLGFLLLLCVFIGVILIVVVMVGCLG